MLPVLEASTGKQNGQIGVIVGIGVSQIAAEEHHGAVKETLIRFEEKAARLPVLLTLPMVAFVLPCIFIVVAGPAGLRLVAAFN